VVGESERAAEINIRRRGLDVSEVARLAIPDSSPAPAIAVDQVISQSPPAKASGISAPKINLLVRAAPPPDAFVMPSFVGQPLGGVTSILQDAGMHLGGVTVAAPPADGLAPAAAVPTPSPNSVIVSQSPLPGEKILEGGVVNFVVR
jgi:beta-lactam-binding protein with PASTA domain